MNLYQFSKSKITGFSASLLVVIALITAFINIFHVVPATPQFATLLTLLSILRWVLAATMIFVWVILNIPPPKLPIGHYIIALAQFGEEYEEEGATEGFVRMQRRYSLRREDVEDFVDDDEVKQVDSKRVQEYRRLRRREPQAVLREAPRPAALPVARNTQTTALTVARTETVVGTNGNGYNGRNLNKFTANEISKADLALPGEMDDTTGKRGITPAFAKQTPPLRLWEDVVGPREVTAYLDQTVKTELAQANVSDVTLFPINMYVADGEAAINQAENLRAHATVWGWVPFHSRHDFVPVFELINRVEDDNPPPGEMELLGLDSFDLGRQTAKYSTIFSAFMAGLGAYGVKKSTKAERDQSLAKAENELSLALIAAYMYADQRRHRHAVDRAIIYFFLGNVRYYRRNLDGAAIAFREVLALDPDMIEASQNLGVVLLAQNRLDYAIRMFQRVLQKQPDLAVARYNLGLALLKKKQLVQGRRELNNAIKQKPNYAAAYRALGVSHWEERAYDEARAYLQEATRINNQYALAHVDLSNTYYLEGLDRVKKEKAEGLRDEKENEIPLELFRNAMSEVETAIRINPSLPEAHYHLSELLINAKQIDNAAESLREAIRLNPDFSQAHMRLGELYRERGQGELAQKEFLAAAQQGRIVPATAKEHLNLGIGYLRDKQLEKARIEFENALKMESDNAEAILQLGVVYQEMGEYDQALRRYQVLLRLPAPPDETYNYISSLYKQQGNDEEAFEVIYRAAKMHAEKPKLQYYLGNVYRRQKDNVKAIESYLNAIRLDPELAEARFNLAMLYLGRKQYGDAIREFETVVRTRPDDYETYIFLGRAYYNQGQKDRAIEALQNAIKIQPEAVEAHQLLGQIYVEQAMAEEAVDEFAEVLRYRPDNTAARELMGKAYAQAGKLELGIETFQSILALDPNSSSAYYNLGVSFTSRGDYEQAASYFQNYITLKPADPDGYFNLALAYNQLGYNEETFAALQTVIKLQPSYCEAYKYLSQVYIRVKDAQNAQLAIQEYQKCKGIPIGKN